MMLKEAIEKHGTAVDAVLNERFEGWPIGEAMALIAAMAREVTAAEKARRE